MDREQETRHSYKAQQYTLTTENRYNALILRLYYAAGPKSGNGRSGPMRGNAHQESYR